MSIQDQTQSIITHDDYSSYDFPGPTEVPFSSPVLTSSRTGSLHTKASRASLNSQLSASSKKTTTRKIIDVLTPRLRRSQSMPLNPPAFTPSRLVRTPVRGKTISQPLTASAVDTARGRYLHKSLPDGERSTRLIFQPLPCSNPDSSVVSSTRSSFDEYSEPLTPLSGEDNISSVAPRTSSPGDIFEPRSTSPDLYPNDRSRLGPATPSEDIFEPRPSCALDTEENDLLDEDPFRFTVYMSDWPVRNARDRPNAGIQTGNFDGLPSPASTDRRGVIISRPNDCSAMMFAPVIRNPMGRQLRSAARAEGGCQHIRPSKSSILLRPLSPVLEEGTNRKRLFYTCQNSEGNNSFVEWGNRNPSGIF